VVQTEHVVIVRRCLPAAIGGIAHARIPGMRNLSRAEARAVRLFDRARTIAAVGAGTDQRSRATTAHLRRGGYDVVPVAGGGVAGIPGAVDLVLVFRTPAAVSTLLEQAAAKRVDAVWFTEEPSRAVRALGRRLKLPIVFDPAVAERHDQRLSDAGSAATLGIRGRRRRRKDPADGPLASQGGWVEAGGGGRRGGGGGRAIIDEKKMVKGKPGRRGRRRKSGRGRAA
jgi:predicted CoA-binding protein